MGNGTKKRIYFALSAIVLLVIVAIFVQRSKQSGSLEEVVVAPGDQEGIPVQEGAPVSDVAPVQTQDDKGAGTVKSNVPPEPGSPVLVSGGSDEKENLPEKVIAPPKESGTLQDRPSPVGQVPAIKESDDAGCRTLRFTHENIESHKDGSLCLEHSNEISLPEDLKSPSFVCVRVNDKVVDFKLDNKGAKPILRFGPGAGVKSMVEVTACVKGAKACKGGCPKQKSRFVSSMGLDEEGARGKLDDQVEREYARLEAAIGAGAKELDLKFKGWAFLNDVPGCKK